MRIIAVNTIKQYWKKYPDCEQALKSWIQEAERVSWNSPNALKAQFGSASIITGKRIVFNINGNRYRLIVDIEFRLQIIFIVWFGSHEEYDLIDSKTIGYVKTDQDK
jgi:mRNA interferase HigB